ncbi:MAG TPA: PRC-barrel domain-containing protein [archaeon]|nr:PRC-barrel domain-containing protein [archaeon]HLD81148.1 PRC-barrel domain-containing protein [archaeon]
MSRRISELFGMDIYTDSGKYKGKVHDLIVDLQQGKITTITTDPLPRKLSPQNVRDAEKIVKSKSVNYDAVRAVSDVLIVAEAGFPGKAPAKPESAEDALRNARRIKLHR